MFGLEYLLLLLAAISAAVNHIGDNTFSRATYQNRYLGYLLLHPELNAAIIQQLKTEKLHVTPEKERLIATAQAATVDPLIKLGTSQLIDEQGRTRGDHLPLSPEGVLQKPNLIGRDSAVKRDIQEYTVKGGDSVGKIAGNFRVSVQTILYENKLNSHDLIKPGQVLKILPTSGITYTMKRGDTISGVARRHGIDEELILAQNEIEVPEDIQEGEVIVIPLPDDKIKLPETLKPKIAQYKRVEFKRATVPNDFTGAVGSLVWPLATRNITQHYSSRHRGLDISNGERPQFWAAQDGIVEISGWQGGYGQTIVVNHGNGLKTRYGHASELYVTAGDKVTKGQLIGRVGNSGRVYGRTGLHLHFEVIKNEVKLNPLTVVK